MGYSFLSVIGIMAALNFGIVGFNVGTKSIRVAQLTKIKKNNEKEHKKSIEKMIALKTIDDWIQRKAEVKE